MALFKYQEKIPKHLVTAVILLDDSFSICYVNPAAEALIIKSAKKVLGCTLGDVFLNHPISERRLNQLLTSGQEFSDNDVQAVLIDKQKVSLELTASSIEIEKHPYILLELKQIDQQKKLSAEAFQYQQWLSGRDLIRGLAHEIKNPLGGLRGAAQLLDSELTNAQREYTSMIIEQADRLTELVDKLLGPNQLPKIETQNIHIAIEKIYKLTQVSAPASIEIVRDYDPSIPDVNIDADKIQQAIINIVNNAIHALHDGGGRITIRTRAASSQIINGKRVKLCAQITILDNGPGIPSELIDTIFYPMVSGKSNGTGLGLAISQTLIQQHNGNISCISHPGHTEFNILLPIVRS